MRFSSPDLSPASYISGGFLRGGSVSNVLPGTKTQWQREYVAGAEHAFTNHSLLLGARFIRRDLERVVEDLSFVTAEAVLARTASQVLVVSNPGPSVGQPDPSRRYIAWEFTGQKRWEEVWQLQLGYRYSTLRGNYEGLFMNDGNQANPNTSTMFDFLPSPLTIGQVIVGNLPGERRHVGNLYLSHSYPEYGWNLGIGARLESGVPITRLAAHPVYLTPGQIPVDGRGTAGRTPVWTSIDGHVDYNWQLTDNVNLRPALDVFNILNQQKERRVVENIEFVPGIPDVDFGQPAPMETARTPMSYQRPIDVRLSLRLEF
jgi:hypothetical protein